MKVADAGAIANAMYFLFQLFLYHLLVMELEAILAVYQANLAVLEVQEVVDLVDQRERLWRCRWTIGLIASFILRCNQMRPWPRIFLPEHNHCPHTRIKCGEGQNLTPSGLERVFPEEYPGSRFITGRKDVKLSIEGALKQHKTM